MGNSNFIEHAKVKRSKNSGIRTKDQAFREAKVPFEKTGWTFRQESCILRYDDNYAEEEFNIPIRKNSFPGNRPIHPRRRRNKVLPMDCSG